MPFFDLMFLIEPAGYSSGTFQIGAVGEKLMTSQAVRPCEPRHKVAFFVLLACLLWRSASAAFAADEPDLIFRRSTVFKLLSPNDRLATYGVDDPEVEGVACHFTVPEKGGYTGWLGLAEEVSDVSLACRQTGPITVDISRLPAHEQAFSERTSVFFKATRIYRMPDLKHNTLVYLAISSKLIDGSPANAISTVPVMPWGR